MIASLRGTLLSNERDSVILEVAGVGYLVQLTPSSVERLPKPGGPLMLHIIQSFGMYGGGETLYGFLTPGERSMFLVFKDNVPSTGAKKSLEFLEKASKSLPDFRRAILDKDSKILTSVFGFTRKTAERLVEALKDEIEALCVPGAERIARAKKAAAPAGALSQAMSALAGLGYSPAEARGALQSVTEETSGETLGVEQILRLALKRL